MFEGIAIYNILREHPQQVTVKVMGMAASAASIIAMAGDDIQIGSASFLMIHNCWVLAMGNRHDMSETAAWLAPFDQAMADVYAARTGMASADTAKLMDAETYLSGSQAVDQGFADSLLPSDKIAPDTKASAVGKDISELYALERTLMANGKSRAEARATLQKIKGKPGAADEGTPSAADFDWGQAAADLRKTLLK
jgi:ClpP class serine protease